MTGFVTTCRTCGREFEPDRSAIVAGTWQTCPPCRGAIVGGPPAPKPAEQPATPAPRELTGKGR